MQHHILAKYLLRLWHLSPDARPSESSGQTDSNSRAGRFNECRDRGRAKAGKNDYEKLEGIALSK